MQQMSSLIKEKLAPGTDIKDMDLKVEDYKVILGKYYGVMIQDIKAGAGAEKTAAFYDAVVSEHKNRLIKLKDEAGGLNKNADSAVDLLLSLRVNALSAPPEQRKNFISSLIKGDVFLLARGTALISELFSVPSNSLKSALCALISIIATTSQGIAYLTKNVEDFTTLERLIDVLKD